MKSIKGILLAALAITATQAQTYDFMTSVSEVAVYVSQNYNTWEMWKGMIRGLQANPANVDHQCVSSFTDFQTAIVALPDYLTALGISGGGNGNTLVNSFTTNPYYQPGTYMKLLKRGSEIASIYFNLFDNCYLDDLVISFGRTINSFSGAFNTLTVSVVYFLNLLDVTQSSNDLRLMQAIIADRTNNVKSSETANEDFGVVLGKSVTKVFNIKVPDFQYQDYK